MFFQLQNQATDPTGFRQRKSGSARKTHEVLPRGSPAKQKTTRFVPVVCESYAFSKEGLQPANWTSCSSVR